MLEVNVSLTIIGTRFNITDPWGRQEHYIVDSIIEQVKKKFKDQKNILITMTWFGPQFKNNEWKKLQKLIDSNDTHDNLFWLAPVDPLCILRDEIKKIESELKIKNVFYIGTGFTGNYEFNTGSISCYDEFPNYSSEDLLLTNPDHLFLCYNRKPKPHRIQLVEKIYNNNLENYGILTLGKDDVDYNVTEGLTTNLFLKIDDDPKKYSKYTNFGGVPYDLLSLGRLDIWQKHFLNIVSETEFKPWDNTFVTEKTWKPIIGLRPFVLNAQVQVYQWLRDRGFKTFNHHWADIELENIPEYEVHDSIVKVVKHLVALDKNQLMQMYQDMLPDLIYNRERFFEFAKEQKHKIDNLFV
jgi:hypothetical protein